MSEPREQLPDDDDAVPERSPSKPSKEKKGGKTSNGKPNPGHRFEKGNKGGPGNPFAGQVAKHRLAVFASIGTERYERALRTTYRQLFGTDPETGLPNNALASDRLAFLKWYSDRTIGKVPETTYTNEGTPPASDESDPDAKQYE